MVLRYNIINNYKFPTQKSLFDYVESFFSKIWFVFFV